jgi:hypothetical protein
MFQFLPQKLAIGFGIVLHVVLDEIDLVAVLLLQLINDGLLLDASRSGGAIEIDMLGFTAGIRSDALGLNITRGDDGCIIIIAATCSQQHQCDHQYGKQDVYCFSFETQDRHILAETG